MVSVFARIGSKGQVVIPKVFRDEYRLREGEEVVFVEEGNSLKLRKKTADALSVFQRVAKSGPSLKVVDFHAYEEEIEERNARK